MARARQFDGDGSGRAARLRAQRDDVLRQRAVFLDAVPEHLAQQRTRDGIPDAHPRREFAQGSGNRCAVLSQPRAELRRDDRADLLERTRRDARRPVPLHRFAQPARDRYDIYAERPERRRRNPRLRNRAATRDPEWRNAAAADAARNPEAALSGAHPGLQHTDGQLGRRGGHQPRVGQAVFPGLRRYADHIGHVAARIERVHQRPRFVVDGEHRRRQQPDHRDVPVRSVPAVHAPAARAVHRRTHAARRFQRRRECRIRRLQERSVRCPDAEHDQHLHGSHRAGRPASGSVSVHRLSGRDGGLFHPSGIRRALHLVRLAQRRRLQRHQSAVAAVHRKFAGPHACRSSVSTRA